MNILKRCCFRFLKENRKRTAVAIVGVILSAALVTGVACLAESLRSSLILQSKKSNGDFHYLFSDVREEDLDLFRENANIEKITLLRKVGYGVLEGSRNEDKPYLYIREVDQSGSEILGLDLIEGRMPQNQEELVIGRHVQYNGMVDLQVGDVLTLSVGERMGDGHSLGQDTAYMYEQETFEPSREITYTIVGIVNRPNEYVENRYAPGYSAFTCWDPAETNEGVYEVYASYTKEGLRHSEQVTAGLLGVSEEMLQRYFWDGQYGLTEEEKEQFTAVASGVTRNQRLLRWIHLNLAEETTMRAVYGMALLAVLVIIVTSVFCIRNSFFISLTEKMKLYGRLASVGTTAAQQRKIVLYEALFIGAVGVPLGILSGLGGSVILVKLVSGMVEDVLEIPLIFDVSVPAVLLAAVLSMMTVFASARESARRAAKLSPISAIRSNDSVKIGRREMKCPGWVDRLFGVGGRIAYRSMKRAGRKYRVTVISIVVSVAVFIGLTTFVQLLQQATIRQFSNLPYQIQVSMNSERAYEEAEIIAELEGVQAADIYRCAYRWGRVETTEEYRRLFSTGEEEDEEMVVLVCSLGEEGFSRFCGQLGVDPAQAEGKAIVLAEFERARDGDGGKRIFQGKVAEYESGDTIRVYDYREDGSVGFEREIPVLLQTEEVPMALADVAYNSALLLVISDPMMDREGFLSGAGVKEPNKRVQVYLQCEDAGGMEKILRQTVQVPYVMSNYEAAARESRSMYLLVSIFLYGFITVVALIGITNIFNTITTNLELRAPEFAMLQAVGMTGREFRRMIWLEGLFYGGKALAVGIPAGLILSVAFYVAFAQGIVTAYRPPVSAAVISAAAVALLLYGIMHYSMRKIRRRNIVETIQNENL